jgi:hypothetical protein
MEKAPLEAEILGNPMFRFIRRLAIMLMGNRDRQCSMRLFGKTKWEWKGETGGQ